MCKGYIGNCDSINTNIQVIFSQISNVCAIIISMYWVYVREYPVQHMS